jgi:putative ABC transport system substrate-binding protein
VLLAVLGLLAAPLAVEAQRAYRIAFLGTTSPPDYAPFLGAFRQGLHDLGYEEGRTILIEYRWAGGHHERLPALAAELVRLNPSLLVTHSTPGIRAAQHATTVLPIVMGASGDPVREGLIKSLARPGGNTTGVASVVPDLAPKRLELLKEAVPTLRRVVVLFFPTPTTREDLSQTERAAQILGVRVRSFEVGRDPAELDTVFAAILRERPDGLIVAPDPITAIHGDRVREFATNHRIPAMFGASRSVHAGGLLSYGGDFAEGWRRAATYVDKILKGAKPADLPVEQPTKFELVINLKTAKALGVTIPPSVLARADEVIR